MKRRLKRKIKRLFSRNYSIVIIVILIIGIFSLSTAYSLLNSEIKLSGKSKIVTSTGGDSGSNPCAATITFSQVVEPWGSGDKMMSIYSITMTNNSLEAYHSWQMKMEATENTVLTTSHATVTSDANYIYLSSMSWNSEVAVGESVTFEAQLETDADFETLLNTLSVTTCGRVNAEEKQEEITSGNASIILGQQEIQLDVEITITEAGAWGGQVNIYTVSFVNNSDYDVTDYRANIYYGPYSLNNVYPCTKSEDADNFLVIITNTSSGNTPLAPGERTDVTLVITTSDSTYIPDIVAAGLKKL